MTLYAVLAFLGLILLAIYFPIGVIREFLKPDDEQAPAWMGDARGRKRRLAIILAVFLVVGLVVYALLRS